MLSHGMKEIGHISISRLSDLILALGNGWIIGGIFFLLAFFAAYMTALSWADLTYVLPASSLGYVLLALIAKLVLHEQVSALRWVGIGLIAVGVSFVASGPERTHLQPRRRDQRKHPEFAASREQR